MANGARRDLQIDVKLVLPRSGFHQACGRLIAYLLCVYAGSAFAYDFVPTEGEFWAWPDYCQARYVTLPIGELSPWRGKIGGEQIRIAQQQLGVVFDGVQHYCAGICWLNRARVEQDTSLRAYYLRTARAETLFSYNRLQPGSSMFPLMATQLGLVTYEMGQLGEALDLLERVTREQPTNPGPYSVIAMIHRERGRLDLALAELERGDAAVGGKSAEICYNFGLMLLESGDVDRAREYAKRAYALGFPLPGLRRKLEKLNAW